MRIYEDALRDVGIDSYLAGSKTFFAQQEVQDLVHLLLWLDDPDDTLSLAGVLRSPLGGLSDDTLFTLTDAPLTDAEPATAAAPAEPDAVRKPPLTAAILGDAAFALPDDQAERLAHVRGVLRDLLACRSRLGPGGLLEWAVHATGYDGAVLLLEFLGERKLANLRKLLRMGRDADAAPDGQLRGFAARLLESVRETLKEDEAATVTQDRDAVTLMTIHSSKGLEFPIVVVCDLDRKPASVRAEGTIDAELGPIVPLTHQHGEKPADPGIDLWMEREKAAAEAEEVRVFYVAATRAADRLILAAGRPQSQGGDAAAPRGVSLRTLDAAFDLAAGRPRAETPTNPLYAAPDVLVHRTQPAGAGTRLPGVPRGTSPGQFADALAAAEPCEPYDLRRPLPPVRPRAAATGDLADALATEAEREELAAWLEAEPEPADAPGEEPGPLAAAWNDLNAELKLPRGVEQRRGLDHLVPSLAAGLPAVTGRIERLFRVDGRWLTAGVAPATGAEVEGAEAAGDGLPDRLAVRLWAERAALGPLGGGAAALLLVAPDGRRRVVRSDRLPAAALSEERIAELLRRASPSPGLPSPGPP